MDKTALQSLLKSHGLDYSDEAIDTDLPSWRYLENINENDFSWEPTPKLEEMLREGIKTAAILGFLSISAIFARNGVNIYTEDSTMTIPWAALINWGNI